MQDGLQVVRGTNGCDRGLDLPDRAQYLDELHTAVARALVALRLNAENINPPVARMGEEPEIIQARFNTLCNGLEISVNPYCITGLHTAERSNQGDPRIDIQPDKKWQFWAALASFAHAGFVIGIREGAIAENVERVAYFLTPSSLLLGDRIVPNSKMEIHLSKPFRSLSCDASIPPVEGKIKTEDFASGLSERVRTVLTVLMDKSDPQIVVSMPVDESLISPPPAGFFIEPDIRLSTSELLYLELVLGFFLKTAHCENSVNQRDRVFFGWHEEKYKMLYYA